MFNSSFRSQLGRLQNWPALQEAVRAGNLQEIARVLREDYEKKVAKEERLRRAEANPMDPENQRILEEHIRQQNIDESLNTGPVYAIFNLRAPNCVFLLIYPLSCYS